MATLQERYEAIEIATLIKLRGFNEGLDEYSRATGKDREYCKGLYLAAADQLEEEGY
jgi:hypothetical protein